MVKRAHIKELENVLDDNSIQILKLLSRGEMTDCAIAEKLKTRANTIRRVLNNLHEKKILAYRKEREKTGWYNYIWRIQDDALPDFISNERERHLKDLQEKLNSENGNHFFECKDGCTRVDYTKALEMEFKCASCGKELAHYDNTEDIQTIQDEMERVKGA